MVEKKRLNFKHLIISLICGFLLSGGLFILIFYLFYTTGSIPVWLFFVALIGLTYWLYKCKNIKRMWGRTFIGLSIEALALPLVMFIFTVGIKLNAITII